jgi:hypothetical protein
MRKPTGCAYSFGDTFKSLRVWCSNPRRGNNIWSLRVTKPSYGKLKKPPMPPTIYLLEQFGRFAELSPLVLQSSTFPNVIQIIETLIHRLHHCCSLTA